MTLSETISLTLSILSLLLAGGAAYFTYSLSRLQLRLANRHEFQKLLVEVNKELVRDPELWAIYDQDDQEFIQEIRTKNLNNAHHRGRLESFAYMFLNVIHVVFCYFNDETPTGPIERAIWKAWQGTADDLVNQSSLVQAILERKVTAELYDERFLGWMRGLRRSP